PSGPSHEKSASVDNVGMSCEDRRDDLRNVCGVVFEVGILNDDDVARGDLEGALNRSRFPTVLREATEANQRLALRELFNQIRCAVARAVVDDDNLLEQRTNGQ